MAQLHDAPGGAAKGVSISRRGIAKLSWSGAGDRTQRGSEVPQIQLTEVIWADYIAHISVPSLILAKSRNVDQRSDRS